MIEELSDHSVSSELNALYEKAVHLLANTQHAGIPARLISCALQVLRTFAIRGTSANQEGFNPPATWVGFSFRDAIHRYERFLIELALREAGSIVTRASQLLGFKHHQSLISLICGSPRPVNSSVRRSFLCLLRVRLCCPHVNHKALIREEGVSEMDAAIKSVDSVLRYFLNWQLGLITKI